MWGKILCKLGVHKLRRTYQYDFCKHFMGITSIVVYKCVREGCETEVLD